MVHLEDADVLRVLELHLRGFNAKKIAQQTRYDVFDVQRALNNKKYPRTMHLINKYPEWRAKNEHLLQQLESGPSKKSDDPVSEYEAKRLQRLQQNQAALAALGIEKIGGDRKRSLSEMSSRKAAEREAMVEAARKNPRRSSRLSSTLSRDAGGRSSTRTDLFALALTRAEQNALFADRKPPVPYQDLDLPIVDLSAPVPVGSDIIKPEPTSVPPQQQQRLQSTPPPTRKQRASSQQLEIDFESFHARWLGNQIWPKGKQTIMQGMCPAHAPMFSKMSGIQTWKNAVVLFVNVQGESQYDNVFHQVPSEASSQEDVPAKQDGEVKPELKVGGSAQSVYFQWFAQQRQHLASPVILRLLNAQKGDARLRLDDASYYQDQQLQEASGSTSIPPHEPVLLFIRHVDGPYIYCGRLGFLGFRSNSSPLEFRWQLLDTASLAWSEIRTLIESSSTQVEGAAVVEGDSDV
ncbi:hypothetical protein Gpo141_00002907 [Globisporangium polare]